MHGEKKVFTGSSNAATTQSMYPVTDGHTGALPSFVYVYIFMDFSFCQIGKIQYLPAKENLCAYCKIAVVKKGQCDSHIWCPALKTRC